jgi:GAF domain-containing protein
VDEFPESSDNARRLGFRTILCVPLIREGLAIGVISLLRAEAQLFTDRQIALLQTFADQAVIAIENVRLFTELEARNREVTEALEQQTATAEILGVISSSPTDVQPVFNTILSSTNRLCEASFSVLWLWDGEALIPAAHANVSAQLAERLRTSRARPRRGGSPVALTALEQTVIHVPDVLDDPRFSPAEVPSYQLEGARSILAVPMLRKGRLVGVINTWRREPKAFTDKQVDLLKTFADQAVIAIENVRLFNETKEALERETATSEILRVISSSPTDVQPIFDSIARSAAVLCEADGGGVFRRVGDRVARVARAILSERTVDALTPDPWLHGPVLLGQTSIGQVIMTGRVLNVPDAEDHPDQRLRDAARANGFRSLLTVPMLRDGEAIGAISVTRRKPGSFSDSQGQLLQTFADQAVIAIENVRLFTELQEKNCALTAAHAQVTESLERQTATSEILRVISSAHTDAQPVFDTIVQSAVQLCRATHAAVFVTDGTMLYHPANYGSSSEALAAVRARYPQPITMESTPGITILTRSVLHLPDIEDAEAPESVRQVGRLLGFRSQVVVPMLRAGEAVGAILVSRRDRGRFADTEVELLKTFSDQAVIAIENVRLFKELQERTRELSRSVEQLTALGEVGRAVSSTLDLETVLRTIVSRAVELSGLDGGVVFEYDDAAEEFVQRVGTETGGPLAEARRTTRVRRGEGVLGRTAITLEPIQVPDITVPGAHEGRLRENLIESGIRAVLAVPMVYEGRLIGGLGVTRNRPGEFPAETIELLRTFATQSALAIQNARLFREIEHKSRELEAASRHKSEFLANMSHELRTPLNAIIGFSEVLSERMFGELNEKQEEYLKDIHASGQHLLSLINDILDLSKIEAGRMELEVTDFDLPMAIDNALTLIRERAARRSIALNTAVDERVGQVQADERKIRQVLLNLLSNAIKFTPEGGRIHVEARSVNESIEVSVTDTGVGIAPEDQDAVFEEFRQVGTADKKVEGTGLGLALSRKFIELHGGKIWVESQVGEGSTFTFTVPVRRGE